MWQVLSMMTLPSIRKKQCAASAYFMSRLTHFSAASAGVAVSRAAKMSALFLMCCITTLYEPAFVCFVRNDLRRQRPQSEGRL